MIYVRVPVELIETFTFAKVDFCKVKILESGVIATFKATEILYEGEPDETEKKVSQGRKKTSKVDS